MNIVEIIERKKDGYTLTKEELEFSFNGFLNGTVTDYQMSSLLMAICIRGMNDNETFDLTDIFINSGDVLDLSDIDGVTVDKHSTGGVGDKTTLILGSIVASAGVKVAKMSGRGLGITGGTIDKLESIPGFNVNLEKEDFLKQVNDIGFAITSQTGNLVPMDKKIYALRDVTGTVSSIPLIASSVMSKKIASGAEKIIIDIKVGNGALLKSKDDALRIANLMKKIGYKYDREVETVISYMDIPLGTSIGNALEIKEVIDILQNKENNYLVALSKSLAAKMIAMAKDIAIEDALKEVEDSLTSGKAYQKFLEIIKYQGGRIEELKISDNIIEVKSPRNGHVINMNAYEFGKLSLELGAGRKNKEDVIDYSVGIVLNKKIGDDVKKGDTLCTLYVKDKVTNVDYDIEDLYTFDNQGSQHATINEDIEVL